MAPPIATLDAAVRRASGGDVDDVPTDAVSGAVPPAGRRRRAGPRARVQRAVRARRLVGRHPAAERQLVLLAPADRAVHARPRGAPRRHVLVHDARHPLGRAVVAGRARLRSCSTARSARSASGCSWRSRARRSRSCRTGSRVDSPATAFARRSSSLVAYLATFVVFSERPLAFGLALGCSWWCGSSRCPTRASRCRPLVVLPIVIWVWVNVHGSFALGVVFIGLHVVGRGARRQHAVARSRTRSRRRARSSDSSSLWSTRTVRDCCSSRCS